MKEIADSRTPNPHSLQVIRLINNFLNLIFGLHFLTMDRFVKSTRVDPSGASSSKRKVQRHLTQPTRPIPISLHHASSELGVTEININWKWNVILNYLCALLWLLLLC